MSIETTGPVLHPAWVQVDLDALQENHARIRGLVAPGTAIIASIKANAYGHGVVAVAHRLEQLGCEMLATGSLREAIELRRSGVRMPILLFGRCLPEAYPAVLANGLTPTIHAADQAMALDAAAGRGRIDAFVKVDAGLGRLGLPIDEAQEAIVAMASLPHLRLAGLYTHLPFRVEAQQKAAMRGLEGFAALARQLAERGIRFDMVQAHSSTALLRGLADPFNAVCPGHALYGIEPAAIPLVGGHGLRPVLAAVRSKLIQVGVRGSSLAGTSYGGAGDARLRGVIPFGQAEGLRSAGAANGQQVLVGGRRVPVLGISFEHAVLDLSALAAPPPAGEVVTLVGRDGNDQIGIEEFAAWQGGSAKDALMSLSDRLPYVYR